VAKLALSLQRSTLRTKQSNDKCKQLIVNLDSRTNSGWFTYRLQLRRVRHDCDEDLKTNMENM